MKFPYLHKRDVKGTTGWEATMFGLFRGMKFSAAILAGALMLVAASAQSKAQTGTVHIQIVKAGFIVGVGGGSGALTYNGKSYRLSIGGVSVGTIGVATVKLVGTARNLRTPADIAGTYGAASASLAIVGGSKVAQLRNEKGVVLEVHGEELGLEASLSLSGMTIALQ
jgi:hypothetical protein